MLPDGRVDVLFTCAVLGVVLAFVTPGFVVRRAKRRLEGRLLARALGVTPSGQDAEADLRSLLELDRDRYRSS